MHFRKNTSTRRGAILSHVMQHEVAIFQWVVCWLIRCKARDHIPGQLSKRNMKRNIFSADFWGKTLSVNKPAIKKFLKIVVPK